MQELTNAKLYPLEMRKMIYRMGTLAVAIANRWMLGWPSRVQTLLDKSELLDYLTIQVEKEQKALAEMTGMEHLAQHEKMAMLEINPAPPLIE